MEDQQKKRILLVEDDTSLASVYRARLELEGFAIREVHNGEEALSATLEFKPDLILLDAMMPKISGFDVLDILRNTPETANVRIIMLTALACAMAYLASGHAGIYKAQRVEGSKYRWRR